MIKLIASDLDGTPAAEWRPGAHAKSGKTDT